MSETSPFCFPCSHFRRCWAKTSLFDVSVRSPSVVGFQPHTCARICGRKDIGIASPQYLCRVNRQSSIQFTYDERGLRSLTCRFRCSIRPNDVSQIEHLYAFPANMTIYMYHVKERLMVQMCNSKSSWVASQKKSAATEIMRGEATTIYTRDFFLFRIQEPYPRSVSSLNRVHPDCSSIRVATMSIYAGHWQSGLQVDRIPVPRTRDWVRLLGQQLHYTVPTSELGHIPSLLTRLGPNASGFSSGSHINIGRL